MSEIIPATIKDLPVELLGVIFSDEAKGILRQVCKYFRDVIDQMFKKGNAIYISEITVSKSLWLWSEVNGCPWDRNRLFIDAVKGGHLEVLQWAHANGCPWNTRTCAYAAENGHLKVLQWAHANGCPWNTRTCAYAAENGHLEVLQWLRANGCPWDEDTCAYAARKWTSRSSSMASS